MKPMALACVFVLLCTASLRSADPPAEHPAVEQEQMQKWWEDLAGREPACSRALLQFAAHPEQSIAFFKERLKPLTITEAEVKSLIADLDSDEENVWKPAYDKLEYFDPRLAIDLTSLMNDTGKPLARTRLVEILSGWPRGSLRGRTISLRAPGAGDRDSGYNFFDAKASWWAEHRVERLSSEGGNPKPQWTRATRAIVILEHIATPEAVAMLRDMSTGHADAEPTRTAFDALRKIESGEK